MTSSPSAPLTRRERLTVAGRFWLLEVLLLALVCGLYLGSVRPGTWLGRYFVYGGALSCAASLSVVPGLLFLASTAILRSRRASTLLAAALWTLVLLLVWIDTRLYGIFRYHFNGLVWNVLTTPGADEAVHLSRGDLLWVVGITLVALPLQGTAFLFLWRRAERRRGPPRRLARPGLAWACLLVPNMLGVGGAYAWADLARDPNVLAFAGLYPLYPRVTIKRLAVKYFGKELEERPEVALPAGGIALDYPKAEIRLPSGGPRPNFVVIVIDSLRSDMLDPDVMPRTAALARDGRTFRDHLSGGNATRFGIFSLVYGLHGSYWHPVYSEHRSPVLVDALLDAGYDLRVLTSASMEFPEFNTTAWVRMRDRVEDRLPSSRPGGRDDGVAERFEAWLAERDGATPFFAFLLLDAPHQSYFFPEESVKYRPYLEEIAYRALDGEASPELRQQLFNRYRNAVHYADEITGRLLDALRTRGLTDDTLVFVTGDHGEEFFENGFWGHTSNFTRTQSQVPFVMAGPGVPPGEELRPTSHVDLPVTVLEWLGADPTLRAEWSLGANLLDPPAARARVVAGWDSLGLHVGETILDVPMAGYGGASIAVYDPHWTRIFDDGPILRTEARALGNLALECRRFLH